MNSNKILLPPTDSAVYISLFCVNYKLTNKQIQNFKNCSDPKDMFNLAMHYLLFSCQNSQKITKHLLMKSLNKYVHKSAFSLSYIFIRVQKIFPILNIIFYGFNNNYKMILIIYTGCNYSICGDGPEEN